MSINETESVFSLITQLCEKFQNDPDKIKETRKNCYEVLLGKRLPKIKKVFPDLKQSSDPFCNLYSWQFQLSQEYDLREHAVKLQNCVTTVQKLYENEEDFKKILQFLLQLRNLPSKNENILDLSSLPPITEFENFNNIFKLPPKLIEESTKFGDGSVFSKSSEIFKISKKSSSRCNIEFSDDVLKDEGYFSPLSKSPENIWELAAKLKYSNRRNWENFGHPEPDKERPFLSELGDLSSLWVENLDSLYLLQLFKNGTVYNSHMVPRKVFIGDLKYLLVGVASESFDLNENGEFYLVQGVSVEGITADTLKTFCTDLMFCGTCYKALNKLSTPIFDTGKYKYQGIIFKEFCESVNRYLKFYCTAIFNIPDSCNYLQFYEKTYELQLQISILASICKTGPYTESEEVPHGVALLNYLYQKVLSLTEQKVITVLYSILYPCCQVYFSRFLKQWVMEGVINDPHGEFFIKSDIKYLQTRGRTYWTRSYSLCEDMVPDFLEDLKFEVLSCGKAMNLLKFCYRSDKLCSYILGENQLFISCCLTLDQLSNLKQTTANYYLDICNECGPPFKMADVLMKKDEDPILLSMIAKKRSCTLKRLELERQKMLQEDREKKMDEINMLREHYAAALEQKQSRIAAEIDSEIRQIQNDLEFELKRQQLIEKEANKMIEYYAELFEAADTKKNKIESHIKKAHSINLNQSPGRSSSHEERQESTSSNDSFHTVFEEPQKIQQTPPKLDMVMETLPMESSEGTIPSSASMDILNANTTEESSDGNANLEIIPINIQQAIDNFQTAKKIKEKVMQQELGIEFSHKTTNSRREISNQTYLTEAQKNKLKVLSSEFDIAIKSENTCTTTFKCDNAPLTAIAENKNKVMGLSDCFQYSKKLDNERFLNKNIKNLESSVGLKQSKSLTLDFGKINQKQQKTDTDKPLPMSVDSTPMSDLPLSMVTTPSTMFMSVDSGPLESIPATAETQQTDEGFSFTPKQNTLKEIVPLYINYRRVAQKKVFSKRVTKEEAAAMSSDCLKLFLQESIQIPLSTQTKIVNDGLLNYFINVLNYIQHLNNLRNYFFLQDGEFGRIITDNLFTKLYDANNPAELINCKTLQNLVFEALDMSSKNQNRCNGLSFEITSFPKSFDLGNPDVLDCISLTYKVEWPLNILLPTNTVGKYDEVFKYLIKLNRMSWVMKKIFLELKLLAKKTGNKEIYLMSSPQYRRIHHCRHIMMHFIQTLQNYVVGGVLQTSWELFEKNLLNVTNLDELYNAHTSYIKNILFMCFLNQKTAVIYKVIHKIFFVILKFYDYLSSKSWLCEDGFYVHPNFKKLNSIFENFRELVQYFFKIGRKVAKSGCQPHLFQLLDLLDINDYISKSLASSL